MEIKLKEDYGIRPEIFPLALSHHSLCRKLAALFLGSPAERFVWQGTNGDL